MGEVITLKFPEPCQLGVIDLMNGYGKTDPSDGTDRWQQNRRVSRLKVQTASQTMTASLDADTRSWQSIGVFEPETTWAVLTIQKSSPSKSERDFTAISEISLS